MKKRAECIILLTIGFILLISYPAATHPGYRDQMGCHVCESNCSEWGLEDGEYHCDDTETDSGYLVTNDLWIRAVIHTEEKGPVKAVWKRGGQDTTLGGDIVIWGHFYASPDDVTWGSEHNPDLFVKIWFDRSGRVDVNFFHVSVPDITVYSAYPYEGQADLEGTTTLTKRYIRQYYLNGSGAMDENEEDGNPPEDDSPENSPRGYSPAGTLRIGAVINTDEKGAVDAVWRKGGEGWTSAGHYVLWGHFFASPDDVNWGSENNPDLFVKIWFDVSGRVDVNYFHVSVPDIETYADLPNKEAYNRKGTTKLSNRYIRHIYQRFELAKLETDYGNILIWLYYQTPKHRANFLNLIKAGFYNNSIFHRVINDFVVQGGKRGADWTGGTPALIDAEIITGLTHAYGAVGAARTSDEVNPERKSSGSQFYIVENVNGTHGLDTAYTVFGQVIDGMKAVGEIAEVATDENDRPIEDVWLRKATTVWMTDEQLAEDYNVIITESE